MTVAQGSSLALLVVTALLLRAGRWPRDLVALAMLVVGVVAGVVPAGTAFAGFGTDAVAILAATMLLSTAIAQSGAIEGVVRPLLRRAGGGRSQVPALTAAAAVLAAVVRGESAYGALAPFAAQLAGRRRGARDALLRPLALAVVLGGGITLIGLPTNLLVARARAELGRGGFALFDFAPVGVAVTIAGLLLLWLAAGRAAPVGVEAGFDGATTHGRDVTAEARLPADSPLVGRAVDELEAIAGGGARVSLILRDRFRRVDPAPGRTLAEGDLLLLSGQPDDIERTVAGGGLVLEGDDPDAAEADDAVREGVVTVGSALVGATATTADLAGRHGATLLAIGRRGASVTRRLRHVRIEVGDVLILKAPADRIEEAMEALRVLPLSERPVALGARRQSWIAAGALLAALVLIVLGLVPPAAALVGAALATLLLRRTGMDEAYRALRWPVLVVIGALIPVADAVRTTGLTDLAATALAAPAAALPPLLVVLLILLVTVAVAAGIDLILAVLVLAPLAAALAQRIGLGEDAALMAVATGALGGLIAAGGGAAGGRAGRLGLALVPVVALVGTAAIAGFWGLGRG